VPIPFADPGAPALSCCRDCASTTNLWICLICGNIGCGRYGRAHAHAHYSTTAHLYALELETQRTWDYAQDQYVHRLIQNKADGKLVELPSASMASGVAPNARVGPSEADALAAEKIEAIGIEYSYLLSSQLDTQRTFYEDQQRGLQAQLDELRSGFARLEAGAARAGAAEAEAVRAAAQTDAARRERVRVEKKAEKLTDVARRLERELHEERAVSAGLLSNLERTRLRAEEAERAREDVQVRVGELEDQVRDVMFFLEAREKIENGEGAMSEAAGGSAALPPPPAQAPGKKKKKK
jgi:BRCA1-associated protein